MVNVTSRITLACVLVLLVQPTSAETVLERSNRILQKINERFVNQYRASAPDVTALPKLATTANPEDLAKQFRQQPLPTKPATPEMMIFVSFSMPRESLLRIVEQSERTGARLIFRGFNGDKMTDMSKRISALLGNHRVEAVIHPPAFTQFKVNHVPALVLAQSDAGDQLESGCAQPDRYVKVTGDVSQDYALEYIERTSPQWAATARLFGDKVKMDYQ
ncbi:MAG: type-F conjugative transfer system pilin assembly protein TrbC [Candidatus Nitrotoga sp.]